MLKTVEARWFFPGEIPALVLNWFMAAAPTSEREPLRIDYYLKLSNQSSLGVKIREGRLEVKNRQDLIGVFQFHDNVSGKLESWTKWSLVLALKESHPADEIRDLWLPVAKQRRLFSYSFTNDRWQAAGGKLGIMEQGCEIELSTITIESESWWTFAFEAAGNPDQNRSLLIDVSRKFFENQAPPRLTLDSSFSYPKWISQSVLE